MIFNSFEFIFIFLPVALIAFFLLGRISRTWALGSLVLSSLAFYAWWRPFNVLIIVPAILVNYLLARLLQRLGSRDKPALSRIVVLVGVIFDIAFLGYFKYANFASVVAHDLFGRDLVLTEIILPLGISFITFQMIAFLLDVYWKSIQSFSAGKFFLFVLFFPQLIAGPIVHYREMMPQFEKNACRFNSENMAVGLTLFMFGLFKKVVLADSIAPMISPIYEHAATGEPVSLVTAWMAAIGFTMQIYFDFSGYTDMALGIARFFGIRLPQNFNSPLRKSSIIDFWIHWHMTLTRFLTAYIYNPLSLALTRSRVSKGKSIIRGKQTSPGAFVTLLMFPTVLTMFVSGLWHGAGYTFIIWGLMHGMLLSINHAWRLVRPRLWPDKERYARFMGPVGLVLTFSCVAASMVVFRASSMDSALNLLAGMIGLNGVALPPDVLKALGAAGSWLTGAGVVSGMEPYITFRKLFIWVAALTVIALALPNVLQLLARYEPALGVKVTDGIRLPGRRVLAWSPSPAWATVIAVVSAYGIYYLGGQSEFLYWQF